MKKNGFTLTELLGVIIILAVLALIVFPPIISHIKKSKESTNKAIEKLIYTSADLYIDDREDMYQKKDGESYCIPIQELIDERYLQQDIEDADGNLIDTEKEVQIRVGYNKELSYSIVNSGKCVTINPNGPVPVTKTIYWALQDNDNNGTNEKLLISSNEVTGTRSGSFSGNELFTSGVEVPWIGSNAANNLSYNVASIVIEGTVAPTSTANWFDNVGNNVSTFTADLSNLYVSNVTNMTNMFSRLAKNATTWSIGDLSNWKVSNVTTMESMFFQTASNAEEFDIGDIGKWNMSKVTNISRMFMSAGQQATRWNIGDLSNWNVSQVTNMSCLFGSFALQQNVGAAYNATTFDIGNIGRWNVSNVTDMSAMFSEAGYNATTWNIGDLSRWNVSNVTNMDSMFAEAGGIATTWNIGNLNRWNVSNVATMKSMFEHVGRTVTNIDIDLSSWNTHNVENLEDIFYKAWIGANTLRLNLSNWDTSNVTNMRAMFYETSKNATTWSVTIPKTNGNGINNTTSLIYGSTSGISEPPTVGKSFTLSD